MDSKFLKHVLSEINKKNWPISLDIKESNAIKIL